MKIKLGYFISGLIFITILLISYFIKVGIDSGANYTINSSLLGILIFYNPFVLGIYFLIGTILIIKGLRI